MSSPVELPADGVLRIGRVRLSGRRVQAQSGQDVAWVTDEPDQAAGRVWLALSGARPDTGLVPVMLADEPPLEWGDDQQDVAAADGVRPEEVFTRLWDFRRPTEGQERLGDPAWESWVADRGPFGRQFPGLAPAEHVRLDLARLTDALDGLEPARIGLVRCDRPADVPAVVGWFPPVGSRLIGSEGEDIIRLLAVLRSWEDRFGANLLQLGPSAELRVLAERPPATAEAATALAAEHWVFSDGWLGESQLDTVQEIAANLISAPIWAFWWD